MMKTIIGTLLLLAMSVGAAPVRVDIDFNVLLPKDWRVAKYTTEQTAPYSWDHDMTNRGVCIQFTGPTKIELRGSAVPESVTVWLMPETYNGRLLQGAQFASAVYLGNIGTKKIFAHSVPEAVTWPTWKDDILTKLKIEKPNKALQSDAEYRAPER
jgi:hypothetical protein